MKEISLSQTFFARSRLSLILTLAVIFILGLGIRLYDLTDPPLDFHPTRQLRNAIVARGIYYTIFPDADPTMREAAIDSKDTIGLYEPPIIETIVAVAYRLIGGENLVVPRILNSVIWLLGGVALFILGRDMTSIDGALIALGYYLFLAFGVQASRSFQPDPLMTVGIIFSVYLIYRWTEEQTWKWAVLAGIVGGLAVLIKVVAAFLVGGVAVAAVLAVPGPKRTWRNLQVWAMAVLMVLPALYYYMLLDPGGYSDYFSEWTVSLSHLIRDPGFYVRWMSFLGYLMSLALVFVGMVGVLISKPRNRVLLLGLWIGYGLYGLMLPYQMYTHEYYHLQFVPVLALSLAPVAEILLKKLSMQGKLWQTVFVGVILLGVFYPLWTARSVQASQDYRHEPAYWQSVGEAVPDDGPIVALTQDYGYRLMYYGWTKVSLWPSQRDRKLADLRGSSEKEFEREFAERTEGKRYFLVTTMSQFEKQPLLKARLQGSYPVIAEGEGYIIYELKPKDEE
ncbi:MAG: glycosyltransferase family 39 protein [Chloroflexi bacterium]|nr:glycosyltransferase family 39 protein [Chloroflexota bacterium]